MTMRRDTTTRQMYESDYARSFDETNNYWDHTLLSNKLFVECQINYLRDLLHTRGHLFLNEVYDALGFHRVPQGQLIGWYYSEGPDLEPILTMDDNTGIIKIELNVINSDVMYFKI